MARNALEKVHFERNSGTLFGIMGSRPFAHKRSCAGEDERTPVGHCGAGGSL